MDFERVLDAILPEFDGACVRYAAIGGFAMGVLGVPRATVDLDFLIHRDDLEKVEGILRGLEYEPRFRTENVVQFLSPLKEWGRIDFLLAFRESSLRMLGRLRFVPSGVEDRLVPVVQPEDLIAFKLQAIRSDPSRKESDEADIVSLGRAFGGDLDWDRIGEYYRLFEREEDGRNLRERFGSC